MGYGMDKHKGHLQPYMLSFGQMPFASQVSIEIEDVSHPFWVHLFWL
jgi:hypothetical protein